jgi:CheY-like chemotaxis protein
MNTHQSADRETRQGGIVAAVTDLLFDTRIRTTAAALGVPYGKAATPAKLDNLLETYGPKLVIVDMEIVGMSAKECIRRAKSCPARPTVLAYLPHVRQDLAQAAAEAGADVVVPRSKFSTELAQLLEQYAR